MLFPTPERIAELKREWTDRFVKVRPGSRAELTRFEGSVGRIATVNFNGKAVVDFGDGAWYDVGDFAAVFEIVPPEEAKSYDPTANSAQKFPMRQG